MRPLITLSSIFLSLILFACSGNDHKVSSVYSGDEIRVGRNKIHLLGIRAPAMGIETLGQKAECYAEESKLFLETLLLDSEITLAPEEIPAHNDPNQPFEALVYYGNSLINAQLIKSGYAFVDAPSSFPKKEEFMEYQQHARSLKIGVWGNCTVNCNMEKCTSSK